MTAYIWRQAYGNKIILIVLCLAAVFLPILWTQRLCIETTSAISDTYPVVNTLMWCSTLTTCLDHLHYAIALEKSKKRYTKISKLKKFSQVMLYSCLEAIASPYSKIPAFAILVKFVRPFIYVNLQLFTKH